MLTDEERATIIAALPADPDAPFWLLDEVERIIVARDARIRAEAWDEGYAALLDINPYRPTSKPAPKG